MNPNGGHGGAPPLPVPVAKLGPGNTLGRGSYALGQPPKGQCARLLVRLLVILVTLARLLVILAIVARLCWPFTGFSDFLGRLFLVNSRVSFTLDYLFTCMFFFQKSSSGEITSSIV